MNSKLDYLIEKYNLQKQSNLFQMVKFEDSSYAFYINTNLNDSMDHLCRILSTFTNHEYTNSLDLLHIIQQSFFSYLNSNLTLITTSYFTNALALNDDLISYYENLMKYTTSIVKITQNLNPYLILVEDYLNTLYHCYSMSQPHLFIQQYPSLRDYQVNYYLTHHQPGIYYSIEDFKEFTKTSYETSRQSMDGFVDLGIYKKRKIGKKYVYTSILTL